MIIQNEAKCLACGDIIWSAHNHDFKTCSCGQVAVDGGQEYIRRVYKSSEPLVVDRSMFMDRKALAECTAEVDRMKETGRNSLGIVLGVIRKLRDNNLLDLEKFKDED